MKGTRGRIWRGLSIVIILALMIGVLPQAPAAHAAAGDSPANAVPLVVGTPFNGGLMGAEFWLRLDLAQGSANVNLSSQMPGIMFNICQWAGAGEPTCAPEMLQTAPNLGPGARYFRVTGPPSAFTMMATAGGGAPPPPGGEMGSSKTNPDAMGPLSDQPMVHNYTNFANPGRWWSVPFDATADVDVSITNPSNPMIELWVYDPTGALLQGQGGSQKFFKILKSSPPGSYLFEVRNALGSSFSMNWAKSAAAAPANPGGSAERHLAPGLQVGDAPIAGTLPQASGTWFRYNFFGEPARAKVQTTNGTPPAVDIYFGFSPDRLTTVAVAPTQVFSFTTSSSPGEYFINVKNASAGPTSYNVWVEGAGMVGGGLEGSSQSSAIVLQSGGAPISSSFTGSKLWFKLDYTEANRPVDIKMDDAPNLAFDVFFGLSGAPIGSSRPVGPPPAFGPQMAQGFTIVSHQTGTYYLAVRSMGFMQGGSILINMSAMPQAGPTPGAGGEIGSQFNPKPLAEIDQATNTLPPGQNFWYSYNIPQGKTVRIDLDPSSSPGIALNIHGFDPMPIAPGVRSWSPPPFFGQSMVRINVAAPMGGTYKIVTTSGAAGQSTGNDRGGALGLPGEMEIPAELDLSAQPPKKIIWFVYNHTGMSVNFKLMRADKTPNSAVKMDIFTGDSNFPQPGSGGNNGFLGGGVPPGPVFIMVQLNGPQSGQKFPFVIQATTVMDFGAPPPGGGAGNFMMPSTTIKARVVDCDQQTETAVPKARVAVIYNGQVISTTTASITGTVNMAPSALPNAGKDGHYDMRGLPPAPDDLTSDTDPGANCAPGFMVGFDINGGLVIPAGDPTFGHTLRLEAAQLQGTVKDPSGAAIPRARVKAIPDFGGGMTGPQAGPMGRGDDADSVVVKTNGQGRFKMGGFMPGIPYNIVAYAPEPDDITPGTTTHGQLGQSMPSNMRFAGTGFSFGGMFGPGGGFTGAPGGTPPGGYNAPPGGYNAPPGGYNAPPGGYNAPPGGYNAPPGGYNAPPGGYNAPPGGYNAPPGGFIASKTVTSVRAQAVDLQTIAMTLTNPVIIGSVLNPSDAPITGSTTKTSAKVRAQEEFSGGFGPIMGPQSSSMELEGYTDSTGKYYLGAAGTGKTYKIVADAPKTGSASTFESSQPRRESYKGTTISDANLKLTNSQITVNVNSGSVGVPAARVQLFSVGSFGPGMFIEKETNATGVATFGGLGDGMYNITSFPPPDPQYFNLAPSAPQQAKIRQGTADPATVTFNLGAATLTGMVYKSDGTTPVSGNASVEIFKTDFTFHYGVGVNPQGAFAAGGMPAGAYKVQAKVHGGFGFGEDSQDTDSVAKDVTIGSDGKPDSSWDGKLVLSKPQVTIFVVDPNGNRPQFPVHISEVSSAGQPIGDGTETDPGSGQALFGGLAAGTHSIGVFLPPMLPFVAPAAKEVVINADGTATAATATITFELADPKKQVKGTVKKANGNPVHNAGIHAFREDGAGNADTFVNSDGTYTLKLAKGGTWLVVLFPMFEGMGGSGKGGEPGKMASVKAMAVDLDWIFAEEPRRVEFTSGDDVTETISDVNFTVAKAGATVTGNVVVESTNLPPAANTTFVDVRDEAGVGNGVPLAEDGTFTVAVPSGITARVRVFSKDQSLSQKGEPQLVEPKEGTPVVADTIKLIQLSSSISGKVVISGAKDANGDAIGVESVEVSAFKEGGMGFARTTTTTGGVYTLAVGSGEWRVTARPAKGSNYTPKGRPIEVKVTDQAVSGIELEVQAADGEITATLSWASGVVPPFSISQLFGFGIALDQSNNSLAGGTPMERGTFKLKVPSGKKFTVSVNFPPGLAFGATPETADLTGSKSASVTIRVAVANADVRGVFVDKENKQVSGIEADVMANGPMGFKSTALRPSGTYTLSLIAGTWYIGSKMKSSGYAIIPPANNKVEAIAGDEVAGPTFTVVQAAGQISGTVKTPAGTGLVARVWAETKPASATEAPRLVADTVSASDGAYVMNAPAGTYVIRAAVPPEKGFLPPLPIEAVVPTTGSVTVDFQFRAVQATISGNVSGPGSETTLVTAFSEKGAWASMTVSPTAAISFTLNATTDDTWHLVASSSVGTKVYRSDVLDVAVASANVTGKNLELKEVTAITLPDGNSITFDATSMQVLALNDGTQVTIPSGALATSGNVTVYVIPTEKLTSQPSAQSKLIGYNLKAFDSNNVEIKQFKQSVTLKVPYPSDDTLTALGIAEDKLKPMYYDSTSGSWVVSEPYSVDTVNNQFIITTDHFTIFAGILTAGATQVGTTTTKIYVPFVHRAFDPGW